MLPRPDSAKASLAKDSASPDSQSTYNPEMVEIGRTVRFCLSDGGTASVPRHNTFASWPPMVGLGRYYELSVRCQGTVDPLTGYFMNIKHIDSAVRDHAIPQILDVLTQYPNSAEAPLGTTMQRILAVLGPPLDDSVTEVRLHLTPFYNLAIWSRDMENILIRHQYEFCAAHRLHASKLSDAENERIFGKCNNPSSHGHNYKVEVVIGVGIDEQGHIPNIDQLDAVVAEHVIEPLDHKNLNIDVPQFAQLNPSVENICQVIHQILKPVVGDQLKAQLHEVSVWETEKTRCTYRGSEESVASASH
jgi:6-pyruvoyltetrahydropterin/6-carboxytetrahydropterin synthase